MVACGSSDDAAGAGSIEEADATSDTSVVTTTPLVSTTSLVVQSAGFEIIDGETFELTEEEYLSLSDEDREKLGPRPPKSVPNLEPATLSDVLPLVCDFERYNGLIVKAGVNADPSGYEPSLETFVRRVLGDRSLPVDAISAPEIAEEQARCDALPNLTFANGSHPVIKQIEATTFHTLFPTEQECSWRRTNADREVVEEQTVSAGSDIVIVVEPTDRSVRIDGCGIFVAGIPPLEH